MISAREEDIEPLEEETPSYEPENGHKNDFSTRKPLVQKALKIAASAGIVLIAIAIIWGVSTKETETWLQKQTKRLNELNTQDIPDIEACKRTVGRKQEKEQILRDIKKYKESSEKI